MKSILLTIAFALLISTGSFAQTSLPYNEDFTGQNGKGATGDNSNGTTVDLSGVNWTIDVGTTLETDGTTNKFVVENEEFRGEDVDGNAFWFSPIIDVSSVNNVDVSTQLDILGSGANSSGENITISFTLNPSDSSPTFTEIESFDQNNDSSLPTTANGNNIDVSSTNEFQLRIQIDSNGAGDGFTFDNVSVSETTVQGEPANHVTNFTATANGSSQIDLSWTDATGSPAPENYLIKVNTGAITAPTDGTAESDDTDFSDGAGALNVAQGTESASITGLDGNTTYNFEIYPYTNNGSNIDYKTDGTVPSANATTASFNASVIISQYIDTGSGTTPKAIEILNISGSTIDFSTKTLIVNRYANGGTSASQEASISSGTLDDGGVLVIGGSDTKTFMDANRSSVLFIEDGFSFNGDDAMEILLDGTRQDVFGTIGDDPGSAWSGNGVSTEDQNIGLLPDVTNGASSGFTDPSTRFQININSVSGPGDLDGFGTPPNKSVILDGSEGFRLLSIPTSSTSFGDLLDPLWTQGITNADAPNNGDPNVMVWDHTSSSANASNFTANRLDLNNIPDAGIGFLTFVFSDDDFDGTPDGFPKTLSLSGSENSGPVSPTVNQNANGFTLLGNPFASTVDFDEFTLSDPGDFTGVVYAWDPNDGSGDGGSPTGLNGSWKTWNTAGQAGDLTGGLIAPFQGFFIENAASVGTPSVTIEEADKATGGTFLGKTNDQEPLAVRMQIEGNDLANSTWLSFTENGSLSERVRGDALKLESLSDTFVQLGTTKPGLQTLLDINHLPLAMEETVEIPLDINSTVSGSFTLSATDFRVPEGMSLTFNNLETGESTPMGPDFETTIEVSVSGDRQAKASAEALVSAPEKLRQTASSAAFSVTIEPDVITSVDDGGLDVPNQVELQQNFPNPFNPSTTIQYALPAQSQVNLTVYDMLGQRVATLLSGQVQSAGSHSVNFDASNLSSGVYIYRLQTGSQSITRKMILLK